MNAIAKKPCKWLCWSAYLSMMVFTAVPVLLGVQTEPKERILSVDDPRPVSEAIEQLEKTYGLVITYEDPQYLCAQDLQDVGPEVAKDYWSYPPDQRPKVIVPRGGKLEVNYDPSRPVTEALQRVIDAAAAAGFPTFRIEKQGHRINVVPEYARDADCKTVRQEPFLDARITLREGERNWEQMLHDIVAAATEATPSHVLMWLGVIPKPGRAHHVGSVDNETARAVLSRTLDDMGNKGLSWELLCDGKQCVLNIYAVAKEENAARPAP